MLTLPSPALAPAQARAERSLFDSPAVLWLLAGLSLLAFFARQGTAGEVMRQLVLPDNDDAMRLVSVRDWLAGQGWFDLVQHRFMPPDGASMHWSRFVDAPIALLILGLTPLVGSEAAEGVVAVLWPSSLFLLYLGAAGLAARRLFGPRAAVFAALIACQSAVPANLFVFGRIDHHNVQILAALLVGLCVACPDTAGRRAVGAGLLGGFSLAVGLEALPFIAGAGLAYGLAWIGGGDPARRDLARFAGALALASLAAFAMQTSPSHWLAAECDALAAPVLLLTSGAALLAAGLGAFGSRLPTPAGRLAAAAFGGLLLALAYALAFPACAAGPFAGMPPFVKTFWLEKVSEAQPSWRLLARSPDVALSLVGPLLAAAILATVAAWTERERRRLFAVLAGGLWIGLVIAQAQLRGIYVASAFLPLVGAFTLDRLIDRLRNGSRAGWRLLPLGLGAALTFSMVWMSPMIAYAVATTSQVSSAKADDFATCNSTRRLRALDALSPGLVLAEIDHGANLLLHTRHAIVAAPYHRNIAGLTAGLELRLGDESAVRHQAERWRADYVLLCPAWVRGAAGEPGRLAARLIGGETVPWLEPVPLGDEALKLWRVRLP